MKKIAFSIFILAFCVRVLYMFLFPPRSMNLDDSYQWRNSALHFMQGQGFLTHTEDLDPKRPPVYPLFLAGVYRLFGPGNVRMILLSQIIVSAFTCVGLLYLGKMLLGQWEGVLAGTFASVYPPLIIYANIMQSETVFTAILMAYALLWASYLRENRLRDLVGSGGCLGLLNLCRGTMLLFPLLLLVLSVLLVRNKKLLRHYGVMAALSVLIVAPWTWRNYKVYHAFIPIVSGGPELLWFGTMPISVQKQYGFAPEYQALRAPQEPKAFDQFFAALARKNILDNPVGYLSLTGKKFIYFLAKPIGHELLSERSKVLGHVLLAGHFLLFILFLNGIIVTRLAYSRLYPLYLIIGYFTVFHTGLMPMPRFRLPVEPFVLLLVSAGVVGAYNFWQNKFKVRNEVHPYEKID